MTKLVADTGDGRIYALTSSEASLIRTGTVLGIGVRHHHGRTGSGTREFRPLCVTQDELDVLIARQGEVLACTETARHRAQKRTGQPRKALRERMLDSWRQECAHPAPERESPKDCWRYVCLSYDMPVLPMPTEEPAAREVVHADAFMTAPSEDTDATPCEVARKRQRKRRMSRGLVMGKREKGGGK